jgi:SAM-dependent methyltransferase
VENASLWDGQYKIPWDEPEFSRRMLREHLSQDHDLASRRQDAVASQAAWIHETVCGGKSLKILDLGCGPGLYLAEFLTHGHDCRGIDFSPASVEYAARILGDASRVTHGDVRTADFGSGHDVVMMIYGELNVFSPEDCANILSKAHDALSPGGSLLVEVQAFEAVRRTGTSPASWYKVESGLFSDSPHVCLTENRWFEDTSIALQSFVVVGGRANGIASYRNTTKAWTESEVKALLTEAGFEGTAHRPDWPSHNTDLLLYTASRP